MAYDDRVIEQVQSLNDIVEILSSYIQLKRSGRHFKALCPFHQEKTPSFMVNLERQIFHCFGCGEGGDVFTFVMKMEQINFPEALRILAERAHITLPETKMERTDRSRAEQLYKVYEEAQGFYRTQFLKSPSAARAQDYWKSRGFSEKDAELYGIGYAAEEWRLLYEFLSAKGFGQELLFSTGLVLRSLKGQPYDLFRSRLIFPIRNAQGRIIAFGGRVMNQGDQPKYLNSPESEIFKKRREFYGLHTAKKAFNEPGAIRQMLIVEGYLDCIRMQISGLSNTVATLGTSLTPDHVRILRRYADEAIVIYDGDAAGEQAALRSLDVFLEEEMSVRALGLPKGMDPDDLIRVKGAQTMRDLVKQAQDFFDFKLQALLARFNKADSIGLLKITGEFMDTLTKVKSLILLDRYLKKLAATLGVEESSLRRELGKLQVRKQSGALLSEEQRKQQEPLLASNEPTHEKIILALILSHPPFYDELRNALPYYEFRGKKTRELFGALSEQIAREPAGFSSRRFLAAIREPALQSFASQLMIMEWGEGEKERAFWDCLSRMKQVLLDVKLEELRKQIGRAEEMGDQESVVPLVEEYRRLLAGSDELKK